MIHIQRNTVIPSAFKSSAIRSDIEKYKQYYKRSAASRAQEKFSESIHGDTPETIEALGHQFRFKCATCETPLDLHEVVSDSWRPRQNAKGLDHEFAPDHYWWLAYEWRNKYCLCANCNNYKATWFPIEGKRAPLKTLYPSLIKKEKALLVDPCNDFPEEHLYLNTKSGSLLPVSRKGAVTIEILKLNRGDLTADRRKTIKKITEAISLFEKIWKQGLAKHESVSPKKALELVAILRSFNGALKDHPQRAFVMAWRQLIITWLSEKPQYRDVKIFGTVFVDKLPKDESKAALQILRLFSKIVNQKDEPFLAYHVSKMLDPDLEFFLDPKQKRAAKKPASTTSLQTKKKNVTRKKAAKKMVQSTAAVVTAKRVVDKLLQDGNLLRQYPEKIEICNFKSISKLSFGFKVPAPTLRVLNVSAPAAKEPWKFLLGENGVGKSSILQAISLVLCGDPYIRSLKINPSDLLRHGTKKGYVKIWFVGAKEPAVVTFTDKKLMCDFPTGKINVLGYGSTRVMPKEGTTLQPESTNLPVKVRNLFDYSVSLSDASKWLMSIDKQSFDHVAKALKDVLDLPSIETYFIREKKNIFFSKNHETLDQLSEGYRSVIALAVDIMKSLSEEESMKRSGNKLTYEVMEGIVLIDEISSHLHPRWQMKIVKAFRKAFPKLQFIVTSHDPLALKGIENGEVLLLKRDLNDEVISIGNLPDPTELRAEQLLTSEFFGLSSTLDPELEIEFNTYHHLLAKPDRSEAEEKQLDALRLRLKEKRHLGDTLREELMYSVIDESLADYSQNIEQVNRKELFETTKSKVLDLWDNIYKKPNL